MSFSTASLTLVGDLSVPFAPVVVGPLRDEELLDMQSSVAEVARRLDSVAAAVAAEIAHRSRRELGRDGLAQSRGQRSPEGLISQLTGSSTRHARTLVKAGELLPSTRQNRSAPDAHPVARWLTVLGEAVARAAISAEAAHIIRTRLGAAADSSVVGGAPSDDKVGVALTVDRASFEATLADAARRLVADAPHLTIEQLAVRASRVRDELDLAGIAAREEARRAQRFLRVTKQLDGMTRISGLLDPESAAIIVPILDAATSPRRGGPRFVDPEAAREAEELVRDERTTDQLALDTLVEFVRIGARVDPGKLLGDRAPAVRILVTRNDLDGARVSRSDGAPTRTGAAYFEAHGDAVSVATAERLICAEGAIPIEFDTDGRVLNLGREQRLFSRKQRIALAARDGGCLMCDRPPSWSEAHHIDHWDEHHGRTDIDDGVLLCRFCHLLVHNRRWRIAREAAAYFLERPDEHGTIRRTPLPSRSPARDRLLATAQLSPARECRQPA